ncbi:SDR family NAD(P)-dependent oxidoreductase [Roseimaritima ulvae]|uniref:Glucose 1-dehydrogenase 2 n=1 Tax=Roseimaritima ulvae TaxID=980254 RepID=A0A5B9QS06_9BACT|nr:SDR family oxidoreductase [Roseimaritima ulvae]QEG39816.1 Glucose 1-dehydrogenase 2 [Roseimaritima ulvae]
MPTIPQLFAHPHPVALVTGSGAARVGNGIARHLAALGCRIVLHANSSIDEAEQTAIELREAGTETLIVQGDLNASEGSAATAGEPAVGVAERIVAETVTAFGRLDVLVNSAAIWSPKRLEDVTADDLRRYFEINTLGSFMAAKAAGLQMVEQPTGGVIINIGDWALVRPYLDHAAYFPSKGAIETMTRSLAVEFAERNRAVRVNCIHPGPVLLADDLSAEKRAAVTASTLVKRVGTPQHVAHAVQFLIENDFVTGAAIPVDGGRTIYADDGLQTHHRIG